MQVNIIEEAGYNSALYGFSLSYKDRAIPREEWWYTDDDSDFNQYTYDAGDPICHRMKQTQKTATANAGRGMGHDKWLRQVVVFLDIEAPRYWWSEMDTYKVSTVAQSESTMHTLMKRNATHEDFDGTISSRVLQDLNDCVSERQSIHIIKGHLPESYLQRRVVSLNYAVLRCIIEQRGKHKLPEWHTLIDALYAQCQHPELLPKREA
jgi:hypothetical protein